MQIILNRKLLLCIGFTAIVGSCTPVPANANPVEFSTTVLHADCMKVSEQSSAGGAVAGAVGGAVIGNVVGGMLFGRSGKNLGTLAGMAGGAVAGDKLGSTTTYSCILKFNSPTQEVLYARVTSDKLYVNSQQIKVVKFNNELMVK